MALVDTLRAAYGLPAGADEDAVIAALRADPPPPLPPLPLPAAGARPDATAPAMASSIWSEALVRSAEITMADVVATIRAEATAQAPTWAAEAAETDPQATFVALAEELGSYSLAAREHPEVWAAAVMAADLNGGD